MIIKKTTRKKGERKAKERGKKKLPVPGFEPRTAGGDIAGKSKEGLGTLLYH